MSANIKKFRLEGEGLLTIEMLLTQQLAALSGALSYCSTVLEVGLHCIEGAYLLLTLPRVLLCAFPKTFSLDVAEIY